MPGSDLTTVVVGVDRSVPARAAVLFAADYAQRRRHRLRVVHAYEPSQYAIRAGWTVDVGDSGSVQAAAQQLVDEMASMVAAAYPELDVSTRLEPGPAVATLLDESATAELLVVGRRGTGGFAHLLVGSTALHVASHARCPFVAIPAPRESDGDRRGVVVGVDGSELSDAAVDWAFQYASDVREPLIAVHTWQDPSTLGPGNMMPVVFDLDLVQKEEERLLSERIAGRRERYPDVVVEEVVHRGHPVRVLADASRSAGMVVVGSHGRGALSRFALGSVSHGVLHHAAGPVAVIRRAR